MGTFMLSMLDSRELVCLFISSYFFLISDRLKWAELYYPSVDSKGSTRSLFRSFPVIKDKSACLYKAYDT